jgi:hypothetical protein
MFFRHSYDKLIYPLVALVVLAAFSYRPKYHLRGDMPPEFFSSTTTKGTSAKRSLDQKIAWAYWESAQMDIQWKYPHGQLLPPDPPPEFRVDAEALGPTAADPATRQLYWRRLQQVWYVPETWQKQYEWDFGWAKDPLSSAGEWLKDKAGRILSGS